MCLLVCFSYPAMHNKGNKSKFTLTFVCNQMWPSYFIKSFSLFVRTLPKAQRTRGLSSAYQSNFFRSYLKFLHKSWSKFIFKISTKHQLQNFNQTSASRLNLKFKILSRISTKIKLHNLYKTSATKYRPNSSFKFCLNFNFKIWPNVVLKVWTKV